MNAALIRTHRPIAGELDSVLIFGENASFAARSKIGRPLSTKQNFGLKEEDFVHLNKQLKSGNTVLFEKIFLTHFSDCTRFLRKKYGVSQDEAYDATMDTLLSFRQRLVEDKVSYGNMRFLFTRMAGQILVRNLKLNRTDDFEDVDDPIELSAERLDPDNLRILKVVWAKLDQPCQDLLQLNYHQGLKLTEIARELDLTASAARKRKERCRSKLIQLFMDHKELNP